VSLLTRLADQKILRSSWKALHKEPFSYGIDKITIDEFRNNLENELDGLSTLLSSGKYTPQMLRGHPLEKGKPRSRVTDKKDYRILKIPTVRDRVVQKAIEGLISEHLNKRYKVVNNGVSFAYVKDGGVEKAAEQIRQYYKSGYMYAYKADIKKFFDRIDKALLLNKVGTALPDKSLLPLIKQFLEIDIANVEQIEERTKKEYEYNPTLGVAQGSPLSPLFANVYLADFDQSIIRKKLKMVRYADDIVILCKTEQAAIDAHDLVESELLKLKLELHPLLRPRELPVSGHNKHSIVRKYSGLIFLGLCFKGQKIYPPSGDSYSNAIWTVRRAAYNQKLTFTKKLISIDARIQGWCSSYAFTDYLDEKTLKNDKLLEDVLTKMLNKSGLRVVGHKTAQQALGIEGYKTRINRLQTQRNEKS